MIVVGDTPALVASASRVTPSFEISPEVELCRCAALAAAYAFFLQILIEQVQMLRTNVTQTQMSDCLIAAGKQIFVVRKRPLFDTGASLKGNHIAGIGGKRLAIVGLVALLDLPFKVRCCALYSLLHLPLGHFAFWFPSPVMAHLLAVDVSSLCDGDLERDAGLALNPFDVCHRFICSLLAVVIVLSYAIRSFISH